MSAPARVPSLDAKYTAGEGRALMSGVQALVRLTLEQRRLDHERGLDTRVFVSGYQGSPLGGVDLEMGRAARFLDEAGVVFRAGLNEELAATAVGGTQLLGRLPGGRHEGVTGFWYGKNPGFDRAADAIRHATTAGTAPLGGAVAWIGDDPDCKSSTLPSSCEVMCQSLGLPLFAPGSVREVIAYGLHAVALSRAAGLWTALKIVADVADSSATVDLDELGHGIPVPQRRTQPATPVLVGPAALDAEEDLLTRRLSVARNYAREHHLNRIVTSPRQASLGVVAAGASFAVVRRALSDLGIDEAAIERLGIRLIALGMPFPLDGEHLAELTEGLETLLVVEDKSDFLEGQIKQLLYGRTGAPVVLGRRDAAGRTLLPVRGTVKAEDVSRALTGLIGAEHLPHATAGPAPKPRPAAPGLLPLVAARTPFFCSGCPHNRSTRTTEDTLVGVGIGCHAMVALDGSGLRGNLVGLTQMGGEGAQWFGLAPFTDDRHFVQNLGDGTFHHSGSLAVRAAVAAGVTMTYKLLYNKAVAMTGGQDVEGALDIPALTRFLALEGVRRIVITTDEPRAYRGVRLDPRASVRHRDELASVEEELSAVDGVTVLIHDDRCAAEERRMRKRGLLPAPATKVVVNERVCEGCGDCAEQSTCLSVQPVETEFGSKTRIHQPSCNSDLSCLKGDCPSFLLVEPGRSPRGESGAKQPSRLPVPPTGLPEPLDRFGGREVVLRMPGIGGTGVVTVSQILQMAAHLDGLHAAGLDQTGLAQKGGPVVSDIRIGKNPVTGSVRASKGGVDVLIGFDLLGAAADATLATCAPERTIAVVNSALVPTAAMITRQVAVPGSPQDALVRIASVTRDGAPLALDAQGLSERLFGDHMPANMMLLGAAYQHGCLPVSARAVERAVEFNGASVAKNLAAFRWGRALALDPQAVPVDSQARPVDSQAGEGEAAPALARSSTLEEAVAVRVRDLTEYQDSAYAERYHRAVRAVTARATARAGEQDGRRIAHAFAGSLHHLMAYKDEYEVARLHLDPTEQARIRAEFGPDAQISVLLHPPVLRALGIDRKIRLRRTGEPAFRLLKAARRLRGTPLDPFARTEVRRTERALVTQYQQLIREALERLTPDNADDVVRLAELPQTIKGYEHIKMARVEEYRTRARQALDELAR
ncbi:indolepyruvate ferredoxin oxidoreductase family protein [Streptomyces sp. TRM66268-LWL]|uniref:Indolepyruvate ferredoxin oxidoreductase family protein n=1 Tax=Streptomyces polyasparticus TaxID=2767826 RepID=A0ABR7SMC3_9ACTN|nr:indolepyruvate ferredoxin oxidoreductase family protein [Streptomyces polyasparticus]MBC9715825.1 indolepyruvate ferredoxin oxidoreductase family protein [Streptomyces polyasparticus]